MEEFTLIVPYYRNVNMLHRQAREWLGYSDNIHVIVVDDGSPEPAVDVLKDYYPRNLSVYRFGVDIPWNRGGARNLGTKQANTDWIVHIDIDHVLTEANSRKIFDEKIKEKSWYRFPRIRIGMADETRLKDAIATDVGYGHIHPHVDSYLITKKLYWANGGYDEDYSGCLGGGSPFLKSLAKLSTPKMLQETYLQVYTRYAINDASDLTLSRDKTEYQRRKKEKERSGNTKPRNPIRFPWYQVR